MLKWAVTGTNRQTHLQGTRTTECTTSTSNSLRHHTEARRSVSSVSGLCASTTNTREKLHRKSSGHELTNIRRKIKHRDKENNLTSTPLPLSTYVTSPLRKLDSLKDLSNINLTPNRIVTSLDQTSKTSKPPDIESPNGSTPEGKKNNPLQYASTLPTFDVEYSPCGVIPGPILALRGVGIADSYFEKPRYLSDEIPECEKKAFSTTPLTSLPTDFSFTRPNKHPIVVTTNTKDNDEESLSSSRMGDVTLDRMIDAILESARKDRRPPKSKQSSSHIMSPTYTPAEDPASDLNEIWDPRSSKYLQNDKKRRSLQQNPVNVNVYNEREVKTPEYLQMLNNCPETPTTIDSCHLRRQKAVRRKRKLSFTSTVRHSAQKLFTNNSFLRRNLDQLAEMETPKDCRNLSPDSGRNSASDLDESATEDVNFLKRRLIFSPVQFKKNEENP